MHNLFYNTTCTATARLKTSHCPYDTDSIRRLEPPCRNKGNDLVVPTRGLVHSFSRRVHHIHESTLLRNSMKGCQCALASERGAPGVHVSFGAQWEYELLVSYLVVRSRGSSRRLTDRDVPYNLPPTST